MPAAGSGKFWAVLAKSVKKVFLTDWKSTPKFFLTDFLTDSVKKVKEKTTLKPRENTHFVNR